MPDESSPHTTPGDEVRRVIAYGWLTEHNRQQILDSVANLEEQLDTVRELNRRAEERCADAFMEARGLKEQLEAAHEALRHIAGWAKDELRDGPPELGLILGEAEHALGSNPAKERDA